MPLRVERVWSTCRNRIRVARVVGIGDIKVKSETLAQSLAAPPPLFGGAQCAPCLLGFLGRNRFHSSSNQPSLADAIASQSGG